MNVECRKKNATGVYHVQFDVGRSVFNVGRLLRRPFDAGRPEAQNPERKQLQNKRSQGTLASSRPCCATLADVIMKRVLRHIAIGFFLMGLVAFGITGVMPPEKWDPSTQMWQNARQSISVRQSLYQHRNVVWPVGIASLGLAIVCGLMGRETNK